MFPIHLDLSFLGLSIMQQFEQPYFIIAIVAGIIISRKSFKKRALEQSSAQLMDLLYTSLLFGLIGTRLSHFLFWNFSTFISNPLILVTPGVGGASITGGLYSGIFAAYIYAKRKKYDFPPIFASLSPALLIAQSIGRIGCFLNGDAFGTAAPKFLGVRFPRFGHTFPIFKKLIDPVTDNSIAWSFSRNNSIEGHTAEVSGYLFPTQLYEILGNIILLVFIFLIIKKVKKGKSDLKYVFYVHVGGYAFLRFLLEFIRADRIMGAAQDQMIGETVSILQLVLLTISITFLVLGILSVSKRGKEIKPAS